MSKLVYLERAERKFEIGVGHDAIPALLSDVSRYIPLHEYTPGQRITHNNTIYFDSEDCFLLRNGLLSRYDHFRIRARKYEYDSTSVSGTLCYWMELKVRKGDLRKKQRIKLEGQDIEGLLKGKEIQERVLDYNRFDANSKECGEIYREIQDVIFEKQLKPLLLTSYKRVAFENKNERLSVDWDIRYFHVGSSVFNSVSLKDLSQKPAAYDNVVILELKYTGELPSWMSDLQSRHPIWYRKSLSKLDRGMKALLEGPLRHRGDSGSLLEMMYAHKEKGWDLSGRP